MERFCILRNSDKDPAGAFSAAITGYLIRKGASAATVTDALETPEDAQALIVLGGDGTMLRAARKLYGRNLPMIGINLGSVGYLTELPKDEAQEALDALIADNFTIEKRMMLRGEVLRGGKPVREGAALNDIVISRRGPLRVMRFENYVNDRPLNTFNADGIVVASPTGSTGYSLSAGGPIVSPDASLLVVTPIAAHAVGHHSVILSDSDVISIRIGPDRVVASSSAAVYFDGEDETELERGDTVRVTRAEERTSLIRLGQKSFLDILRQKLQIQSI